MKKNKCDPENASGLRRQAEAKLIERLSAEKAGMKKAADLPAAESDPRRLIHEMEVHQIELEMQNEELRTSRAEVEAGLALYADLYDYAPTGYMTLGCDGAIRQVNLAGARLLGIERSRLVNRRFGLFVAECDRCAFSDFLQKVFASGAAQCCEVALPQEGHPPFFVRIDGTRSANGQECRFVMLDITEHKQAEEDLRRSEQLFRDFFERSPAASFFSSVSGDILSCNEAFMSMFEFSSREEVRAAPFTDLYWDSAQCPEFLDLIREQRSVSLRECRFRSRSGKLLTALESTAGIFDAENNLCGLFGFLLDITARREAQAQLLRAQKIEAVGCLAGGIAHDFNNILTIIMSFAELARDGLDPGSPQARNLEQVEAAAQRAARLTRQLLAYSRQQIFELRALDLRSTVKKTLKLVCRVLSERIQVEFEAEEDIRPVRMDEGQMEQVLINLVINARDAMENGGRLSISLFNAPAADLPMAKSPEEAGAVTWRGPSVVLKVSDTGAGMSPEVLSKIFDPYFTTKGKEKGTGLGLAVVEGIIRQHGGTIQAFSEPGKGSTFTLCFPAAAEPVAPERCEVPERLLRGSESILLVEDEEAVRESVRLTLESLGYSVITANDEAHAKRVFEMAGDSVDLVLSDMIMPGAVSGRGLCEDLRRLRPGIKTLLMSGHADDLLLHEGIEAGEIHFIPKPFTRRAIASKIREALDE